MRAIFVGSPDIGMISYRTDRETDKRQRLQLPRLYHIISHILNPQLNLAATRRNTRFHILVQIEQLRGVVVPVTHYDVSSPSRTQD